MQNETSITQTSEPVSRPAGAPTHSLNRSPKHPLASMISQSPSYNTLNPGYFSQSFASIDHTADSSSFISNPEENGMGNSNPRHESSKAESLPHVSTTSSNDFNDDVETRKSAKGRKWTDFNQSKSSCSVDSLLSENAGHESARGKSSESIRKHSIPEINQNPEAMSASESGQIPSDVSDHAPELGSLRSIPDVSETASQVSDVPEEMSIPPSSKAPQAPEPETQSQTKYNAGNASLYNPIPADMHPTKSNTSETRANSRLYNNMDSPLQNRSRFLSGPSDAGTALMPDTPPSRPNSTIGGTISDSIQEDPNDSSVLNDTRGQFDLDISPDQYQAKSPIRQSPWRQFRANNPPAGPHPFLHNKNIGKTTVAAVDSSTRIDNLTKELTNCKIQLRLYEKFLQDIINNKAIDFGDLPLSIDDINNSVMKSPSASEGAKNLVEMSSLVEDLYCSLEDYQNKWRDSDQKASALAQTISRCVSQLSKVLDGFGIEMDTFADSDSPEEYLNEALEMLRDKIDQANPAQARNSPHLSRFSQSRPGHSATSSSGTPGQNSPTLTRSYVQVQALEDENEKLRREIRQLQSQGQTSSLEKNVDKKLDEYQAVIDRLQTEVNEFKSMNHSASKSDFGDSFRSQNGLERLQSEYDMLALESRRSQERAENEVRDLKNQLHVSNLDVEDLRSQLAAAISMQREYEASSKAQKANESERIKLGYQVQALQKEREKFVQKIDSLTEKLANNMGEKLRDKDTLEASLSRISHYFSQLFDTQIGSFQKLMKSFNKIADDASLQDSRVKLEQLQIFTGEEVLKKSPDYFAKVKENHRSLSEYFARAVDVIVNDHIRLLLKDSEKDAYDKNYIAELTGRIKALELENANLSKKPSFAASPRSKLRIEELTNRWKSEREARILDNRQAKERFKELERER